jgi:uncharacterized protein YdeI (YjbR/CyaY-like superfamily)
MVEQPELTLADAMAWRSWLGEHHGEQTGVWLRLAKKGTTKPTSLTYATALEEALCYGWIDGQARRADEVSYWQRFTPRRKRSQWSQSNVGRVEALSRDGRMHEAGLAEVARAKADGRWERAGANTAGSDAVSDAEVMSSRRD